MNVIQSEVQKSNPKANASQIVIKKSGNQTRKVDAATEALNDGIPKDMRVIGTSGVYGDTDRQVVLELKKAGDAPQRYIHIALEVMVVADTKELKRAFAKYDYCQLPDERGGIKAMAKAIIKIAMTKTIKILTQSGLSKFKIQGNEYMVYVWGSEAYWFGEKPAEKVLMSNSAQSLKSSGTLKSWQETIGSKMSGNHRFIVLACHSLSAAIRGCFDRPYTAISLVGESSRGKSTCQYIMQSLSGEISKVMPMVGSEAGLTKQLAGKNNVAACFEDAHLFGAENLMKVLFSSVDGATRHVIGNKDGALSSLLILSSEKLLADMKNASGSITGGIYARLLEIIFLPEIGVFDNLHGAKDAATFSIMLEESCGKNYGKVWPAWLDELSLNWVQVEEFYEEWRPKIKAKLIANIEELTTDPVTNRLLNELVFSAFAGCLAVEFGILTITKSKIIKAFAQVMREHLARKRTEHSDVGPAVIAALRGLLDEKAGKFQPWHKYHDTNKPADFLGYTKTVNDEELFLFIPSKFESSINKRFDGMAYEHLEKAGYLVTSEGRGNQLQVRLQDTLIETNKRRSFVAIRRSIMFDDESEK